MMSTTSKLQSITKAGSSTVNKLNSKVKGTFLENWLKFWKNVLFDYREVAIDVGKSIRKKPLKAFFLFSGATAVGLCAKYNPDERNFRSQYIESANEVLLVHPSCQNPLTVKHLRSIESNYNKHVIQSLNVGIASVIYVDSHSESCNTYESNCSYLRIKLSEFNESILDFGFLNVWWILSRKMLDYDVNFEDD